MPRRVFHAAQAGLGRSVLGDARFTRASLSCRDLKEQTFRGDNSAFCGRASRWRSCGVQGHFCLEYRVLDWRFQRRGLFFAGSLLLHLSYALRPHHSRTRLLSPCCGSGDMKASCCAVRSSESTRLCRLVVEVVFFVQHEHGPRLLIRDDKGFQVCHDGT